MKVLWHGGMSNFYNFILYPYSIWMEVGLIQTHRSDSVEQVNTSSNASDVCWKCLVQMLAEALAIGKFS
jgi:hypothetical protein